MTTSRRAGDHECGLNWFVMRSGPSMGRLHLLEAEQALPHHAEIRQRAGDDEPMPVLGQAAVADLGEAEDAFDHADRMLDPRAHTGLPPIRRAQLGRRGATMDEVARVGCAHTEYRGLARVRRIAPHAPFLTVYQPRQDVTVMDVGGRDFDGMNELALAIDAEVPFHAEVPLPALLRLMHPGIARAGGVLRGRRGGDDRGIDDRA